MNDLMALLWGPLGGVLAAAAGVLGLWVKSALDKRTARKEGAERQRAKDAKETIERVERGRQAVQRGRDSGKSADQRLRDNDGRW